MGKAHPRQGEKRERDERGLFEELRGKTSETWRKEGKSSERRGSDLRDSVSHGEKVGFSSRCDTIDLI